VKQQTHEEQTGLQIFQRRAFPRDEVHNADVVRITGVLLVTVAFEIRLLQHVAVGECIVDVDVSAWAGAVSTAMGCRGDATVTGILHLKEAVPLPADKPGAKLRDTAEPTAGVISVKD